ncbi:MAG TPA: DUF881 domain-containing protein [Acidimicrobiales bacterium]|nr:DUF881 domain-containing protein [Acidimicrobiales bacterium]
MRRSRSLGVATATTVMAFVVVVAFRGPESASPESRLPERYRLADLIERQQEATDSLRSQVEELRARLADQRSTQANRSAAVAIREDRLAKVGSLAGIDEVRGPGLRVTLDDSDVREPPAGAHVNDLVVHSQDVQAAVNALWRAGAEAVSINGQRLVATSAVLCVGNTLLLNGTVHSPPYEITAIGASRDRFEADRLVRRLREVSAQFGVRVDVQRSNELTVPAYGGSTKLRFARPVS